MKLSYIAKSLTIITLLVLCNNIAAQKTSDLDRLYWSPKEKITLNDFGLKSADTNSGLSSVAFSLEYNIHGLSNFSRNFNKRVSHYMIRSASQIALDGNEQQYIRYQQTLFDIQEIYVRRFRKALKENRKKLFLKTSVADELKDEIIGIDLPDRQTKYNNESNRGKNIDKQEEWEAQIQIELDELKDFAFDK